MVRHFIRIRFSADLVNVTLLPFVWERLMLERLHRSVRSPSLI